MNRYYEVVELKTEEHIVVYVIGTMLNGVVLVHDESGRIGRMSSSTAVEEPPIAFQMVRQLPGEGFDQLRPEYDRTLEANNISMVTTSQGLFFEFPNGEHIEVKVFTDAVLSAMEEKIDEVERIREQNGSESLFDSDDEDSELGGPDDLDDDEEDDFIVEDDVAPKKAKAKKKVLKKKRV